MDEVFTVRPQRRLRIGRMTACDGTQVAAYHRVRGLAEAQPDLAQKLQVLVNILVDRHFIQEAFATLKLPLTMQAQVFIAVEEDTTWGFDNACTSVLTQQYSHRAENLNRQVSKYLLESLTLPNMLTRGAGFPPGRSAPAFIGRMP